MLLNHLDFASPRLAADSEIAETLNHTVAGNWFDLEALNAMLAQAEPDMIICFVKIMCEEVHAGFRVVHRGRQTAFQMERYPLLDHDKALGEAMRMADEYERSLI